MSCVYIGQSVSISHDLELYIIGSIGVMLENSKELCMRPQLTVLYFILSSSQGMSRYKTTQFKHVLNMPNSTTSFAAVCAIKHWYRFNAIAGLPVQLQGQIKRATRGKLTRTLAHNCLSCSFTAGKCVRETCPL